MLRARTARLVGTALLAVAAPAMAADALKVTPPKLEVREHKLANGLELLMYEDHSVPVGDRPGLVPRRLEGREEGAQRLRPPLRAHDVQGLGAPRRRGARELHRGRSAAATTPPPTSTAPTTSRSSPATTWSGCCGWRPTACARSTSRTRTSSPSATWSRRSAGCGSTTRPSAGSSRWCCDKTYTTHPYRIPSIGSMADLDAATIQDVRDFHRTLLRAQQRHAGGRRATSTPGQVIRWIEKYFGPIPKGKPIPRDIAPEPAQKAERRAVDYHPNTPLPAVVITYHVPQAGHPDTYALQVASNILSGGESSRLYRRMVYEKQMAVAAGGDAILLEDPGVFFFYAILQGGQKPEDGEKELLAEVERLRDRAGLRGGARQGEEPAHLRRSSSAARPAQRQGRRHRLRPGHPGRRVVRQPRSSPSSRRSPPPTCSGWRAPISAPRTAPWSTCSPRPCARRTGRRERGEEAMRTLRILRRLTAAGLLLAAVRRASRRPPQADPKTSRNRRPRRRGRRGGPLPRLPAEDAGQRPAGRGHRAARAAAGLPAHGAQRRQGLRAGRQGGPGGGHGLAAHQGHAHPLGAADRRGHRLRGRQPRRQRRHRGRLRQRRGHLRPARPRLRPARPTSSSTPPSRRRSSSAGAGRP